MPIRAVTFDAADTLIRVRWVPGQFAVDCAIELGIALDEGPAREKYERLLAGRWTEYRQINRTRDHALCRQFWVDLTRDWLFQLERAHELPRVMDIADRKLYGGEGEIFSLFDDVRPALELLRDRGVKLAVISNWDYSLHRIIHSLGAREWFDEVVASLEEGIEKPEPEIFGIALERLGVSADDAVHVGDHPVDDIQGARGAGMRSILIDRSGAGPNGSIASLNQLDEVLDWNG